MYLHLRTRSQSFNSLLQAAKERKAVRMRARLERLERRLRLVQRQAAQGRQGPVQRLLRAPDEEVPQGTVDLDDEDTPKANIDASDSDTVRNPSPVPIVLGIMVAVIALGALIGTYVYFKKKHKADS